MYNSAYPDGALLLVAGSGNDRDGRLTVNRNGTWGTICDDGWEYNEANVACFQMGFAGVSCTSCRNFSPGSSSTPILLDDLDCAVSNNMSITIVFQIITLEF